MDAIERHLQGYAQTVEALELIRRGVAPAEATARLLIALAGKDCTGSFTDREFRKLSTKLNSAAQNLIRCAHGTHGQFVEALGQTGAIAPVAKSRGAYKTSAHRREYMKNLMRKKRARERAERNKVPIAHFDGAADASAQANRHPNQSVENR
jgi:hypothetical protein